MKRKKNNKGGIPFVLINLKALRIPKSSFFVSLKLLIFLCVSNTMVAFRKSNMKKEETDSSSIGPSPFCLTTLFCVVELIKA